MSEPWDIPPFPTHGDLDVDVLYAAKGQAVSAWEEIEVSLCYLFAIFSGEPWDKVEAYRRYGEPLNFNQRADALEHVACSYFVRNCNQALEGVFYALIGEIRRFQIRRNEITHSIVAYKPEPSGAEYYLVPPEYSANKFDKNDQFRFVYIATEIHKFWMDFRRLSIQLNIYAAQLTAP